MAKIKRYNVLDNTLHWSPKTLVVLASDHDAAIAALEAELASEKRRIARRIDAKALILKFARDCASDVLYLWAAPQVVKDFLATGENADAAYAAANAANAANAAAYAAANAAAYAAYAANAANTADAAYAAKAANAANADVVTKEKYRGWFKDRVDKALAAEPPQGGEGK